jgi:GT2 family glycosyltransferase
MSSPRAREHGAVTPRTAAVVLNYQTPRETVEAVRALQASSAPPTELIVVDNASGDDSVATFEKELAGVTLLRAPANGGFSAGCNRGIAEALDRGVDRVFLVNSDVIVERTALSALENALDADRRLGIVGPVVVSLGDPGVVQSMGITYSRLTGRMRHAGCGTSRFEACNSGTRLVDGVSGCAMLIRREVFAAAGAFAEEFFFGFEDLDLCLRAASTGLLSACVSDAVVRHAEAASIGRRSANRIYFATRNHLLLARRFSGHDSALRRATRAAAIAVYNLVHVLTTSPVPRRAGLRGFAAGVRDHVHGRYGPRPQ